jgi:hypothetical protein
MKRTYIILVSVLVFIISSYFIDKFVNDHTMSLPQVYGYEYVHSKFPNALLAVEELEECDDLLFYYEQIRSGVKASFDFRLQTLPTRRPMYVIGYELDSTIMEIKCYSKVFAGGYFHGYVVAEFTHSEPPPSE